MKLAFSTLGCPDWSFNEIYAAAKDLHFDGVEVRGIANELRVPKIHAFTENQLPKNLLRMQKDKLEIPMLTSGISVGTPYENPFEEACEYMDLAQKLKAKYVRILVSNHPGPEPIDIENAALLYEKMCKYGEDKEVTPLIETNGVLADSKVMAKFISGIGSENKGVLWDVHHPYRYFLEKPAETVSNIGEYIKYVHVKDSILLDGKLSYRMMGYGDVPIFDALKILKENGENGYNGYISFEWVKRWNPDLEEAGIVFAHFMSYITFLLSRI